MLKLKINIMWNDIIISNPKGFKDKGTGASKCFDIEGDHSISENKVSFWISDLFLGFSITVFKDTLEGIKLTEMIKEGSTLKDINKYLTSIILTKAKHKDIIAKIEKIKEKSYQEGLEDKAFELRKVLMIN